MPAEMSCMPLPMGFGCFVLQSARVVHRQTSAKKKRTRRLRGWLSKGRPIKSSSHLVTNKGSKCYLLPVTDVGFRVTLACDCGADATLHISLVMRTRAGSTIQPLRMIGRPRLLGDQKEGRTPPGNLVISVNLVSTGHGACIRIT